MANGADPGDSGVPSTAGSQYCDDRPTGYCEVNHYHQEPASNIPGQIGRVRATVKVWDHDPFWGRPHQDTASDPPKRKGEL